MLVWWIVKRSFSESLELNIQELFIHPSGRKSGGTVQYSTSTEVVSGRGARLPSSTLSVPSLVTVLASN